MFNAVDKTISAKFCLLLLMLLFSGDVFLLVISNMEKNIFSLQTNDLQSNIGIFFTFILIFSFLVAFASKIIAAFLILLFKYRSKKNIKSKIKSKKYMRIYKIKNKAIINNNSTLYQYILKNEESKNNYFIIMSLYVIMTIMLCIDIRMNNSILHNLVININDYSEHLVGIIGLFLASLVISGPILLALIYNDESGYIFTNRNLFKKLYKYKTNNKEK
jgi:small-conductance mechanosensitive channel